jgi:Xaa-Pro aminopeptidase
MKNTMSTLIEQKLEQAGRLVAATGVDVWLTFVRETGGGGDPVLPFLVAGGLTWQSALMVTPQGERVAVVGNYDADPLLASGHWTDVAPYVQGIRAPLLAALDRLIPADVETPRIAVNYSTNDDKADGLSHGMYLLLAEYLQGTRFEHSLVSAEEIVMALRSQKVPEEIARMRGAIAATEALFAEVAAFAAPGRTEREVYEFLQSRIDSLGLGYAWDRRGDPIVNSGPDSMIGHGVPSASIALAPGHIFHIDLGVARDGYSSDIQRCWYVPHPGETELPADVQRALAAVVGAIEAGARALKPGTPGWQVDAAAREFLTSAGYPEYLHAFGHQVGQVAHDGGSILGPTWERYGRTPYLPIQKDQVYTLELGVIVEGRGYLGLEEMAVVTEDGIAWLTTPQRTLPLLNAGTIGA